MESKKALILASGGIDSLTAIAIAIDEGYEPVILSFDYGQRNAIELQRLKKSLEQFTSDNPKQSLIKEHIVINCDFSAFNSSLLLQKKAIANVAENYVDCVIDNKNYFNERFSSKLEVEKYSNISELPSVKPSTYVPARNTIFASYAIGLAESLGVNDIFIGIHKQDAPNYPDCTKEYFEALKKLASIATQGVINIHAPLIDMSKAEIVKQGLDLGVEYVHTLSCYDPDDKGISCKKCHSCLIRKEAFILNNINNNVYF